MWQGERLEGRSIAIIGHGGHGDTFQHLRHIPALRAAGAGEIVAVASPRMAALVRSAGVDRVVGPICSTRRASRPIAGPAPMGWNGCACWARRRSKRGLSCRPASPRARAINAAIRRKAQEALRGALLAQRCA
jgi:hypothetical protein